MFSCMKGVFSNENERLFSLKLLLNIIERSVSWGKILTPYCKLKLAIGDLNKSKITLS